MCVSRFVDSWQYATCYTLSNQCHRVQKGIYSPQNCECSCTSPLTREKILNSRAGTWERFMKICQIQICWAIKLMKNVVYTLWRSKISSIVLHHYVSKITSQWKCRSFENSGSDYPLDTEHSYQFRVILYIWGNPNLAKMVMSRTAGK